MTDTEFKWAVYGWMTDDGSPSDELMWAFVRGTMTRQQIEARIIERRTSRCTADEARAP